MKKKITTIFLVIALVLTLIPSAAFASDPLISSLHFQVSSKDPTPCTMTPAWGTNSTVEYTVIIPDYTNLIYFKALFGDDVCAAAKVDKGTLMGGSTNDKQ